MRYTGELPRSRYPWKEIPGSSHDVLLSRISALGEGLSVLDVGFGAGHLARRIRARCRYLAGIELDAEAAREAAAFFDDPVIDDVVSGLAGPWRSPSTSSSRATSSNTFPSRASRSRSFGQY